MKMTTAFLCFSMLIRNVTPFASWLMAKCLTSIRDPKALIMNQFIVPSESSSSSDSVLIQVFGQDDQLIETSFEDGRHILFLDSNDMRWNNFTNLEFKLKLEVKDEKLQKLEYVFDLVSWNSYDEHILGDYHKDGIAQSSNVPRVKGVFTSSKRGCEGSRAYGKYGDDGIDLEITLPILNNFYGTNHQIGGIDIVAGWASKFENVTLTRSLEFLLRDGTHHEL